MVTVFMLREKIVQTKEHFSDELRDGLHFVVRQILGHIWQCQVWCINGAVEDVQGHEHPQGSDSDMLTQDFQRFIFSVAKVKPV